MRKRSQKEMCFLQGATALLFLNGNTTECDTQTDKSCGGAKNALCLNFSYVCPEPVLAK
jgi:hypothetical protein